MDFTDLNKACPKDPFLVPWIDQLVDATVGHSRISFLDASRVITKYLWLFLTKRRQLS